MSTTQTTKFWAEKVSTLTQLPEHFQQLVAELIQGDFSSAYVVYAPSRKYNDAVLMLMDKKVVVLKQKDDEVHANIFNMEEIQLVQMGSTLLDSWLKICGKTNGRFHCEIIDFNTVLDELFEPVLDEVRRHTLGLLSTDQPVKDQELDDLKELNLKFYNYGKMRLLPGQRVLACAYQPEVKLSFWKRTTDRETEPHLLVLTEEELLMIKETAQRKKSATQKYSGIWTHIPLMKINTIELAPSNDGWGELTIQLEGQKPLTLHYQEDHMEKVQQLIDGLISQKTQVKD